MQDARADRVSVFPFFPFASHPSPTNKNRIPFIERYLYLPVLLSPIFLAPSPIAAIVLARSCFLGRLKHFNRVYHPKLDMEAVGGDSHETEEVTASSISAVDQLLDEHATAAQSAATVDLFRIPTDDGEWNSEKQIGPNQCPETNPGEAQIDDATANIILRPSFYSCDVSDSNDESTHNINNVDTNNDSSAPNNFDLLGFAEEETIPRIDSGVLSDINVADKDPVATMDSELDILGSLSTRTELLNEDVSAEKSETTQHYDSARESVNSFDGTIRENATVIDEACVENPESFRLISTDHDCVIEFESAKVPALDDDNSTAEGQSRTLTTNIMIDGLSASNDAIVASREVLQPVCANDHNNQESSPESADKDAIPEDNQTGENFLGAVDNIARVIPPVMPLNTTNLSSDNFRQNFEKGGDISGVHVSEGAEGHTEEEEEWLSMGLGLGDALRQIVALTDERDLALAVCQEKDEHSIQVEALLGEVQSRLQAEMSRRAESDSELRKVREAMKLYEDRLSLYETMEDDLEKANAGLVTLVTEKTKIEMEVAKLRETIEESEQKEAVLSNRLNEAKKKEANKASAAGRLDAENEQLREDLQRTTIELDTAMKAKTKLEINMEKLKAKAVERVKQAETALAEERELNEERKKKMKTFVENKAEEVKTAKESANDMQKELEETRASLRSSRDREEAFQKELEATRLKNRELQREMERMKRSSEQLHQAGNSLEQELEKYASETEEHKKKRMSAKHEIMQMVRTLESERAVSAKLKEAVKFTLTPKALSQQELLTECLREFDLELERLAIKTGKALQPSAESSDKFRNETTNGPEASDVNGELNSRLKKSRSSRADVDTERLISNLEQETQHISKGIMALAGNIDRMRSLLNDENMFGCMSYFSNILGGTGEARHQRLTENDAHHEENNAANFV